MAAEPGPRVEPELLRTARGLAFAVLEEHRRRETFVADEIDRLCREHDVPVVERRLARQIATGVLRRRSTVDAVVGPHVSRPRERVEHELWTLLRIGAYQLVFLDSVPSRAAVHETVGLAERLGRTRWKGFLNGVLRSVDRSLGDGFVESPSGSAVPIAPGRHRRLNDTMLPDPTTEPASWLADAFGLPGWLVERWADRFPFDKLVDIGFWFAGVPGLSLRTNLLRTTRDALAERLRSAGHDCVEGAHPAAIHLAEVAHVPSLPGFEEGHFTVQDESAMRASTLLAPRPGDRVLDVCAAPGTKTTHLAELLEDRGTLVACDVSADRLARLAENVDRLGLTCVEACVVDEDPASLPTGPFDAILLDVPCSNTGVLGKRPEARWRLRPNDLVELTAVQRGLLTASLDRLAPNGRLVYSTCSIEPEENAELLGSVLAERPEFTVAEEVHHHPGRPADGAYQALVTNGPTR